MKNFSFIFALIIAGCTQQKPLQHTRWSGQGYRPSLAGIQTKDDVISRSAGESISVSQQAFEGIPVHRSFVKRISLNKKIIFESSATAARPSQNQLNEAKLLQQNRSWYWLSFLLKYPDYKNWEIEKPVSVILNPPAMNPALQVVLRQHKTFAIRSILFNTSLKVINVEAVGSQLTELKEVSALAYPQGPVKSDLSHVKMLRDLNNDGLKNLKVKVDTESQAKIKKEQNLELPPTDDRFEQVQAFYFANKILNWFSEKLAVNLDANVNILTQVGFPEKTNAAFYYNEKIRLGTGDDIVFSKIYLDPSIVMHETSHFVIDHLARLPFTGEGGSLNEAFADVFTTFFLNSSRLGEVAYKKAPFVRNVDSKVTLKEKNGGLYHDSAIVSGFFWALRSTLGEEPSLQIALRILNRLDGYSDFADFTEALKEQVELLPMEQKQKVVLLMQERGFL
ncbi:hypothetical protein [Pseudobdellovibrio sp. HCB154]|uniref:hypothetical protein n=1 Tax=Pseudobdellovibrio sp. HCB154 TaxID=3386277 RepID=UPI003916D103